MDQPRHSLRLVGGRLAIDARTAVKANLELSAGRIQRIAYDECSDSRAADNVATVNLENCLLLPGLINAHDHLEFNLFPRLGCGPYSNSADWARDIYQPELSPVREHLAVPKTVRLWWGGVKNLLSGVTTVCHHNPYDEVFERGFPVRVVRRYGWAHSMTFDTEVSRAFASTSPDQPFIIHAGEGTDEPSRAEVFELDRIGALDFRTILVHGVAFSKAGHALREQRGAALVWCPTSNRFLLGTTLDIQSLGNIGRVALGSDSALTARGNLLDEIHAAHEEGLASDSIYRMVTETAASILHLNEGEGRLQAGCVANMIVVPWTGTAPADAVAQITVPQIQMVIVAGRLHLASDEALGRCDAHLDDLDGLEWIAVDGVRLLVRAPIQWLISETTPHLGNGICLAGKRVSA